MVIRFTKRKDKTYTLACLRDNGSSTWSTYPPSSNFAQHDLVHFAVETTLGYRDAFYGLLAGGRDIPSFGERDQTTGKSPTVPLQAAQTEFIVSLLQAELYDQEINGDFMATLALACGNLEVPVITAEQLDQIRRRIRALLKDWADLPAGGSLEFTF